MHDVKTEVQSNSEPDWRKLNFHQIMVLICDTFGMTHPQMMALRQKLEAVYGKQQDVTINALAILAYRQIAERGNAKGLNWMLQAGAGKLIQHARKIDRALNAEQA